MKLSELIQQERIRAQAFYGEVPPKEDFFPNAHPWKVVLRRKNKQLTVPFYMGAALTREPTVEEVMSCLVSDALAGQEGFEEFCGEYGYDPDSRAHAAWRGCRKIDKKLRRFLGDRYEDFLAAEKEE